MRADRIAAVNTIFEDREGNLWLGTDEGVARLRDPACVTYPNTGSRRTLTSAPRFMWIQQDVPGTRLAVGGSVGRRGSETGENLSRRGAREIYAISGHGSDICGRHKTTGSDSDSL